MEARLSHLSCTRSEILLGHSSSGISCIAGVNRAARRGPQPRWVMWGCPGWFSSAASTLPLKAAQAGAEAEQGLLSTCWAVLGCALSPVAVWTHAELLLCPSWGAAGWGAGSAQGLRTCYGRRPCLKRDPLPRAGVGRVRPLLGEMDEFKAWVRSSPEHGLSLFDPGSVTFPELPDTGTALVRCFAEQKCRWRPGLVLWGGAVVPSAQPSYSTTHLCLHPHSSAAVGPGSAGDPGLVGPAASLHDSQGWVLWVLLCTKGP